MQHLQVLFIHSFPPLHLQQQLGKVNKALTCGSEFNFSQLKQEVAAVNKDWMGKDK